MNDYIKRTGQCKNLFHKSQLVTDFSEPDRVYSDSYYFCDHFKKRITKKFCSNCKFYNRLR